jgi:hypothetical protein
VTKLNTQEMLAGFDSARWVARSLRALGGEATLGDLLVMTGLPSSEVEESLQQLMALGGSHVRVNECGDMTYRLAPLESSPPDGWSSHTAEHRRIGPRFRRFSRDGALGFDHKTLNLIRARRGVLSLAELVEHTGLTLHDAELEMCHLERDYGGQSIPSLDGHLVWVFPQLMTTAHGRFATREPRPAWVRARAPLRRPLAGRSIVRFGLYHRVGAILRAAWSRRPFRALSRRELRRFALGHIYRVALAGKGVVSLDRAVEFVQARVPRWRIRRSRMEAVLRGLAAEFDGPITEGKGNGLFFGFRNVKRQFLASEIVRCKLDLERRATGRIVFDSADSPSEAQRREIEIFDEELRGSEPPP